jgi:hypothetical protein
MVTGMYVHLYANTGMRGVIRDDTHSLVVLACNLWLVVVAEMCTWCRWCGVLGTHCTLLQHRTKSLLVVAMSRVHYERYDVQAALARRLQHSECSVTSATAQEVRGAVDTILRAHQQSQEETLRTATAGATAAAATATANAKASTADTTEKGTLPQVSATMSIRNSISTNASY